MFPDVGSGSLSGFDDAFPFGIAVGDTTGGESVIIGVCVGDGTVAVAAGVFVGLTVTVGVFVTIGVCVGFAVTEAVFVGWGVGDTDGFGSSDGCTRLSGSL